MGDLSVTTCMLRIAYTFSLSRQFYLSHILFSLSHQFYLDGDEVTLYTVLLCRVTTEPVISCANQQRNSGVRIHAHQGCLSKSDPEQLPSLNDRETITLKSLSLKGKCYPPDAALV